MPQMLKSKSPKKILSMRCAHHLFGALAPLEMVVLLVLEIRRVDLQISIIISPKLAHSQREEEKKNSPSSVPPCWFPGEAQ